MIQPHRMRKGYVQTPTGQVHYRETGEGLPLLLSHASPWSSMMFERAYPLLAAAGIRAIGMDTPGFGMSDVPEEPPEIGDYAAVIPYLLDALGLEKAAMLGHHTGSAIVCEFAVRHPERVSRLILNGPALFTQEELRGFLAEYSLKPVELQRDGSHLKRYWHLPLQTDAQSMHRNAVQILVAGSTSWYGHRAAFAYDMEPRLMALTVPTLILTNTGDDIYQQAVHAHQLRPDMEYVELQGGTHHIVDQQTQAWVDAVLAFLGPDLHGV